MKKSIIRKIAKDCHIPFEIAEDGTRYLDEKLYFFADEVAMLARVRDAPCAYACESVAFGLRIKRLEAENKKLKLKVKNEI